MVNLQLSMGQVLEIMRRLPYFQELDEGELGELATGAQEIALKKKEVLFHQGDPSEALYTVVSGHIKLTIGASRQQEKVVGLLGRGQSFGEITVFLGEPCPNTAQAIEDTYILAISRDTVMQVMNRKCLLASKMLVGMCRRMHDLIRDIDNCHLRSAAQRVACYLLQSRPDIHALHYDVNLPSTKQDVATMLNLTPETFSRTLQQLGDEGCIRVMGRHVRILNLEKLQSYNGWTRQENGAGEVEQESAQTELLRIKRTT
jgi:CRP/FNR family transcriptional regulator, dissimilatory nitrate respiration regulator